MEKLNVRKAAMIGCGFVGSAAVYALMQAGIFSEIVMLDVDKKRAEGEALDISHGLPFAKPMKIYAGEYEDLSDASLIMISAGCNQKPGETRLDLIRKNISILSSVISEIIRYNRNAILLIIANPVDILTYAAQKLSGFPEERVIGSGTVLDTARLKYLLGEHLRVDSRSIHAFIVGEHGDSEMAVWSSANVSGIPIHRFCEMRGYRDHDDSMQTIAEQVKNSAYEIIARKKATYYGIGMAIKRICEAIVRDEKSILPVSSMVHGFYGIKDIVLSLPVIVGKDGVESQVPIGLNDEEQKKLLASAEVLKEIIEENRAAMKI